MSTARESADGTMWTSLLHAGLAGSFMRFPHVPARTEALREAKAGAAIYGVPFDATSPGRSSGRWMSSARAGRRLSVIRR